MGTGYTRNDTANNIADGNVINASDLDGEFDAVQAAFNASTGHSHDGTTGEGPQIQTAGLADDAVTGAKIDSTTTITAAGFTGPLTGNVSGNVTGNASTATALQTARTIAGQSFDGTANISIAPTDLTGVTSTAAELNILDGVTSTAAELNLVDGSAAGTVVNSKAAIYGAAGALNATSLQVGGVAITATPAELNTLDGITASTAELNIMDGVTATTTELNYTDGVTSNIQTQLDGKQASGDYVTATGDTMTGNLNFGDNDKAQFGDSQDLQIYHSSGGDSFINENNASGWLYIQASNLALRSDTGEYYIDCNANGSVDLYYDNSQKLTTTATGVTVTGTVVADGLSLGDSDQIKLGASDDLQIYHTGSNSYIEDAGTGKLIIQSNGDSINLQSSTDNYIICRNNAEVELYYDASEKFATTGTGVTVTGRAVGTLTTDNDLSFDMNASNQFKCTPTANGTLTFTNITAGQSGNIFLVNSGGYAISAAATTYISAADLSAISTAGSYFLSYFSDGTNVMVSASAAVTSAGA